MAKPGEIIEVAATKAGLTRIGDARCKMCQKIQHASWAESSHADDWSDDLLAAVHEHKPVS